MTTTERKQDVLGDKMIAMARGLVSLVGAQYVLQEQQAVLAKVAPDLVDSAKRLGETCASLAVVATADLRQVIQAWSLCAAPIDVVTMAFFLGAQPIPRPPPVEYGKLGIQTVARHLGFSESEIAAMMEVAKAFAKQVNQNKQ